jgi:aspartyl-tRNA(Asn)/glutamyl-tRNA(Gln) amidotransferase subunit A
MCEIAIGSDTGGSVRIPAAFCGVVGFKPSKWRVPTEGAFPLSYTLDSIGPLAKSVAECAVADAVLAGDDPWTLEPMFLQGLRLGVPLGRPLANLDEAVTARFTDATKDLGRAGVRLSEEQISFFDDVARINAYGIVTPAEAYAIHRELIATRAADFDPFVRFRIEQGRAIPAADYVAVIRDRIKLIRAMDAFLSDLDALVLPTTPIVAPTVAEVSSSLDALLAKQLLLVRNTNIVNLFDLCAISLPLPRGNGLPVGLMLVARNVQDRRLLRIAAAVERLFA